MASFLRLYLVAAAALELHSIFNVLTVGSTKNSPILRELVGGGRTAQERWGIDVLWVGFLWNLAISRLALAYDVANLTLFGLVVFVHISEAILFLVAVPSLSWRMIEYWVVPFSVIQAAALAFAWLVMAL